ncbi:hypothetical protein C1933_02145 [Stenotrophomonas sp. ZAC14D2_NAIMI4_6]|nr:hypothetical protein C1933_02145 [Stenotrophomonas sp. ZAC14D2_NAIMI4_6]
MGGQDGVHAGGEETAGADELTGGGFAYEDVEGYEAALRDGFVCMGRCMGKIIEVCPSSTDAGKVVHQGLLNASTRRFGKRQTARLLRIRYRKPHFHSPSDFTRQRITLARTCHKILRFGKNLIEQAPNPRVRPDHCRPL